MEDIRNIEKTLLQLVSEGSTVKVGKFLDQYTKIPEVSTDVICYLKMLLNCKDESGFSPLQISAKFGFSEICDLLINCGADIDISSENCPSPLMLAASNNHYDVARLLLERNANISSSCPEHTAADEAALKGHTEIKNLINDHVVSYALDLYFGTANCGFLRNYLIYLLKNENNHPVRLILNLRNNIAMASKRNISQIIGALKGLRAQEYFANNEKLSWICHSIAYFFSVADRRFTLTKLPLTTMRSGEEILDELITSWLQKQPKNGYSQDLLECMQDAIYDYPFKDSKIYKNMTSATLYEFSNEHSSFSTCETCRNRHYIELCKRCENVKYCDSKYYHVQYCQELHWPFHKNECNKSPLPRSRNETVSLKTDGNI